MRQSRRKTLACLVAAVVAHQVLGVLAMGRAMAGDIAAKHSIKRVWRFLKNEALEVDAVAHALVRTLLPAQGRVIVLADWTDLAPYQQLVFALPRDGRALPVLCETIRKDAGEGAMVKAERRALERLARLLPAGREVIVVADRGFGNARWLQDVKAHGWHFVQRLSTTFFAEVETYSGGLGELRIRRGARAQDRGQGTVGLERPVAGRLVTVFAPDAQEPWLLWTDLEAECTAAIVRLYQRRMWIEAMFRDFKNERWGLGLETVRLSQASRHDRLFCVLALAYVFLCAFGARAECQGLARRLKANTVKERVMTLMRLGVQFLRRCAAPPHFTHADLQRLPQ